MASLTSSFFLRSLVFSLTIAAFGSSLKVAHADEPAKCRVIALQLDEELIRLRKAPYSSREAFAAKGYEVFPDDLPRHETLDGNVVLTWRGSEEKNAVGTRVIFEGVIAAVKLNEEGNVDTLLLELPFRGESLDAWSASTAKETDEERYARESRTMEEAVRNAMAQIPTCQELFEQANQAQPRKPQSRGL